MKPSPLFTSLRWLLRQALHVYFNKIEIVGEENVRNEGSFILSCNHQNAFLDSIIVGVLIPRNLHFLTRSDVFTKQSIYWLKKLNMLPIYRIRDGIKALGNNEQVFSQCAELFDKGESVMIFPEGNHGEHYYLRPLTKGTSRIALEALSNGNSDLKIVPCGLNFFAHRKARTKVIIAYGKPIAVKKFQKTYKEDKQAGLKALTAALSDEMKECLIIPEPTPDYEMKAKHVFNPKNEGMDFQKLRELASKDYSKNANQIIEQPPPNSFVLWLTSLPNWGPHWMLIKIIKPFKDKVFWTSMKFSCMIIIMPVWWGLSFVVGYFLIGFWGGMSLVFLSILGLFVRAELLK